MASPSSPSSRIQPPIDQAPLHPIRSRLFLILVSAAIPTTVKPEEESRAQPLDLLLDADNAERIEKLKKYEAAYAWHLKARYFSKKALNGGDIFDLETTIDNEVIRSSRWPCTRSFADPIQRVEDQNRSSPPVAETSGTPSKKAPSKKSLT